jgi:hypothetical protein
MTQGIPCVLGGMAQVSDGGEEEAPDRRTDPEANAIGVPSAELSLGWMLASRANLRFTRREVDTASASAMQEQARVADQEGWQSIA